MTREWPDVRAWLQTNTPTARGMCLNTSMRSYAAEPAGASDATAMVGITKDLHTDYTCDIPAGAHVLYTGGSEGHGHSVVSDGDGYVWTVDWYSGLNITRVAQADMESAWGNLRWSGWSAYYGDQPLDLDTDDPDPPPPEEDPMPEFANAAGADLTADDDPASITWDRSWGHDYRTGDHKGLTDFTRGVLEVHVNLTPSDSDTTLLLRQATYTDGKWWHGQWYEFARTGGGTGQGVTWSANVAQGGAWKVQAKANGAGTVKLTDIGVRGQVW
jgi:hypothetical protein